MAGPRDPVLQAHGSAVCLWNSALRIMVNGPLNDFLNLNRDTSFLVLP